MRKILYVSVLAFCLFAFIADRKIKVVFFGDSITELAVEPGGYIKKIDSLSTSEHLNSQYEFVGAGVSGNKIYDLYLRIKEDVISKKPDIVVIYIGVNDVWHKQLAGTGTDPDKFVGFYRAIIKTLRENGAKVMICTPAVIGEKRDSSNEQDGDLNSYSQLIRDLAKELHAPLVDLRTIFLDYEKLNNPDNVESGILTRDRVHLNEKGNLLVAGKLWEEIKQLK